MRSSGLGARAPGPRADAVRRVGVGMALALIVGVSWLFRARHLGAPLERDEGDYAYIAELLLEGVPPYMEAYEMRPPGIFAWYALSLSLFGHDAEGIRTGLMLVNGATIALLFVLGRRLLGAAAGLGAAASYAVLSLGPAVHGTFANTEHFLILPVVAGLLVLGDAPTARRCFGAGVLLGVAFLVKQSAVFFIAFAGLFVLFRALRDHRGPARAARAARQLLCLGGGALAPLALVVAAIGAFGDLGKMWFWTVVYPLGYVDPGSVAGSAQRFWERFEPIAKPTLPFWCLAALGLGAPFWCARARRHAALLVGFAAFSLLSVAPGLVFRPHYFVQLLPAVALLVGVGLGCATERIAGWVDALFARAAQAGVIAISVYAFAYDEADFLLRMTPPQTVRRVFGLNPFPESVEVARYLRENSAPDDRIAVLGSEPQILFYARRRSASPYILTYPLMEYQPWARAMQEEMIGHIERAAPRYVVLVQIWESWARRRYSELHVMRWANRYVSRHYRQVGLVEISRGGGTRYRWDEDVRGQSPETRRWIGIYERRERQPERSERPPERLTPSGRASAPESRRPGAPRASG